MFPDLDLPAIESFVQNTQILVGSNLVASNAMFGTPVYPIVSVRFLFRWAFADIFSRRSNSSNSELQRLQPALAKDTNYNACHRIHP